MVGDRQRARMGEIVDKAAGKAGILMMVAVGVAILSLVFAAVALGATLRHRPA